MLRKQPSASLLSEELRYQLSAISYELLTDYYVEEGISLSGELKLINKLVTFS
ncbi:MAG: hypothetical protein QNJ68_22365 [Microcoleaceae cyanobacterium MO_207.B10]|nr:hypothetical protein [Microcoleaceae cyanobacterium MO_207.B10]